MKAITVTLKPQMLYQNATIKSKKQESPEVMYYEFPMGQERKERAAAL
jgi:hypothetical protein